jgi:peroxisome-assembly ATPase
MSEQAEQGFYFVGKHYSTLLKQKLQSLIGDEEPSPQTVEVIMGRKLQVW